MTKLRTYAKDGTELSPSGGTTGNLKGGLDWVGGDTFVVAHDRGFDLVRYTGTAFSTLRTIKSYANVAHLPLSASINRNWNALGDDDGFMSSDGLQIATTFSVNTGAPGWDQRMAWHDIETGANPFTHDFGVVANWGGITNNGNEWYITLETTGASPRLLRCKIENGGLTVVRNHLAQDETLTGVFIRDMCFDGAFLWALVQSSDFDMDVMQYDVSISPGGPPKALQRFAISGAHHDGIATDGHNLIVYSDT